MADISAPSLQTALTPVALPTAAAPLGNAGKAGEPGTASPPPSFDALLALQAAVQMASPEAAAAILPESGKTLPDAAIAVAALPLANVQQIALPKINPSRAATDAQTADGAETDPLAELADESAASPDSNAQVAPQPDIALFTAIFAAPERLANPAMPVEAISAAPAPAQVVATPAASAKSAPASPAAVAVAIASTAQIELVPPSRTVTTPRPAPVSAPATAAVAPTVAGPSAEQHAAEVILPETAAAAAPAAALQAPRAVPSVPSAAPVTSDAPMANTANETAPRKQPSADAAVPQPAGGIAPTAVVAEAPVQADVQPVSTATRSEARAERIDFATLVDTLARAREEASPRTINVAVTNTDFGRVSLRFDNSDDGLAVAMSAADPGFARAVSASADAAATSADTRNPNQQASGSQTQADARAQASDANAQRHNQNQQGQQHAARSDARPASGTPTSTRRDTDADKTGDSGIYA